MSAIELFSFTACPYAQRVRMALIEKELEFELVEIDLHNRPAWFREISPYGKVPVLRHEGHVIYESAIINQYLDEAFPARPLMPANPWGRAVARIWMDYCDTRYVPAIHKLLAAGGNPQAQAAAQEKLGEVLRFLEHEGLRKLGDGPCWLGATPTLPDIHYLPFFERFPAYQELAGAVWPADCTRLRQWYEAAGQRQSFLETRHTLDFHLTQQRQMLERLRTAATGQAARN